MTIEVTNLYEDGELKEFTCIIPSKDGKGGSFQMEVDFHDSDQKDVRVSAQDFTADSLDFLMSLFLLFNNATDKKRI